MLDTSDLPGGVLNIVTGHRDTLAQTIVEVQLLSVHRLLMVLQHDNIDAVWYFGSEEGSRNVEFAASENMKRTW